MNLAPIRDWDTSFIAREGSGLVSDWWHYLGWEGLGHQGQSPASHWSHSPIPGLWLADELFTDLPDTKWHWSLLILTIPCLQSCPIDADFIPIFLVPQSCLRPTVASASQWMPALEIMSNNDPALTPHTLLTPEPDEQWASLDTLVWTSDPEVPLVHTDLAPSPWRCFSPDVWTLLLSPVWASVSSWSALGLWLASCLHAYLWLAKRLGSREACVSESHKLVFKALYLLIKPTSEEFVTRTPALFVSVPKWSTRARPNWDLLTKLFSSLAFVMLEAFCGRRWVTV